MAKKDKRRTLVYLIPEIINFTNEVGLTDYFIDSLEGMKQEETS